MVAGVEEDGGAGAWFEADLDPLGGDVQQAGGLDEVAEDGVGGGGLVAAEPQREVAVDAVGDDRQGGVEVDDERDLGGERVEVEGADLGGELVFDQPAFGVALEQLLGPVI